jgi:hypothetical protein
MKLLLFAQATVTEIVHVSDNLRIPQEQNDLAPENGALPCYIGNIHDFLNDNSPGKGIVHGEPTAWLRRSPDLTPVDFT